MWRSLVLDAGLDKLQTRLLAMVEGDEVSLPEAMEISGHRTWYVFDRYHIVSDDRMRENAATLEQHLKAKKVGA